MRVCLRKGGEEKKGEGKKEGKEGGEEKRGVGLGVIVGSSKY